MIKLMVLDPAMCQLLSAGTKRSRLSIIIIIIIIIVATIRVNLARDFMTELQIITKTGALLRAPANI